MLQEFPGHSHAVVFYDKLIIPFLFLSGCFPDRKTNISALRRIFDCIGKYIHQHLTETHRIPHQIPKSRIFSVYGQVQILFRQLWPDNGNDLFDLRAEIHRFRLQFHGSVLYLRQIQNIIDQIQQILTGRAQFRNIAVQDVRLIQIVLHQFRQSNDGIHGGTDIMAHAG